MGVWFTGVVVGGEEGRPGNRNGEGQLPFFVLFSVVWVCDRFQQGLVRVRAPKSYVPVPRVSGSSLGLAVRRKCGRREGGWCSRLCGPRGPWPGSAGSPGTPCSRGRCPAPQPRLHERSGFPRIADWDSGSARVLHRQPQCLKFPASLQEVPLFKTADGSQPSDLYWGRRRKFVFPLLGWRVRIVLCRS